MLNNDDAVTFFDPHLKKGGGGGGEGMCVCVCVGGARDRESHQRNTGLHLQIFFMSADDEMPI